MSQATFRVTISALKCKDFQQRSSTATEPQAFLVLNFDHFKKMETVVTKSGNNPSWTEVFSFEYTTKYADCLDRKYLTISAFDDKKYTVPQSLGEVSISLQTIASGCVSHVLSLRDGVRIRGTVCLDIIMEQVSSSLHINLRKLNVRGFVPNIQPIINLQLVNAKCTMMTHGNDATAEFSLTSIALKNLVDEIIRISIRSSKTNDVLATCDISLGTILSFLANKDIEFDSPLVASTGAIGREIPIDAKPRISGTCTMTGVPSFAQMSGGVHTDSGIEGAQYLHPSIPMRPDVKTIVEKRLPKPPPKPTTTNIPGIPLKPQAPVKVNVLSDIRTISLLEPLYKVGENTFPDRGQRLFATDPTLPCCWMRRLDIARTTVAYENLSTNRVEVELPTSAEIYLSIPAGVEVNGLGIAFEPNFSGLVRYGWRSGRRNSGYDIGAVVRSIREDSWASKDIAAQALRPGHHLISINGVSTINMTFAETMNVLKNAVTTPPLSLCFFDPYHVSLEAAASVADPTKHIIGTIVGTILEQDEKLKEKNVAFLGKKSSASGAAVLVAELAPVLRPGATSTIPATSRRTIPSAQRILDNSLSLLRNSDLHAPMLAASNTHNEEEKVTAKETQEALTDIGFLRTLNTLVTGVPRDTLPIDVARAADAAVARARAAVATGAAAATAAAEEEIPAEIPLLSAQTAELALEVLSSVTATTKEALAAKPAPAYEPNVRPLLKDRALMSAETGIYRRVIESVAPRKDVNFAMNAVKDVATVMRVYELGPKRMHLDAAAILGLASALRKGAFEPVASSSHAAELMQAFSNELGGQDGTGYIAAVKRAIADTMKVVEAGWVRKNNGTEASQRNGATMRAPFPVPLSTALESLLDLDMRTRELDDAAVPEAPDSVLEGIASVLVSIPTDLYIVAVMMNAASKLVANIRAAKLPIFSSKLLEIILKLHATYPNDARIAEGTSTYLFLLGRDMSVTPTYVSLGVPALAVELIKRWNNHIASASGSPCSWPPPGAEDRCAEGIVFSGNEKWTLERNAARPRLARISVNIIINLACNRNRDKNNMTPVDYVVRAGIVSLLGDLLRQHGEDPAIVTAALNCSANIAFKNRDVQLALGALLTDAVVLAGYQYTGHGPLSSMALRTLGNLTNCDENIYRAIGYGAVRMIIGIIQTAPPGSLQALAASVLANIASTETQGDASTYSRLLHESRNARIAASAMVLRPSPEEIKHSEKVLSDQNLLPWYAATRLIIVDSIPVILSAIENRPTDLPLVEGCLRALQSFCSENAIAGEIATNTSLVSTILRVMRANDFDMPTQRAATGILYSLTLSPIANSIVSGSDAVHAVATAISTHKLAISTSLSTASTKLETLVPKYNGNNLKEIIEAAFNLIDEAFDTSGSDGLRLLARASTTLKAIQSPRTIKLVLELGIPNALLSLLVNVTNPLNVLSQLGLHYDVSTSIDPLYDQMIQAVIAVSALISEWTMQNAVTPTMLANLRSDRHILLMIKALEYCVITSTTKEPKVALNLHVIRAILEILSDTLLPATILRFGNGGVAGNRTFADQKASISFQRGGGLNALGLLAIGLTSLALKAHTRIEYLSLIRYLYLQVLLLIDACSSYIAPLDSESVASGKTCNVTEIAKIISSTTSYWLTLANANEVDDVTGILSISSVSALSKRVSSNLLSHCSAGASVTLGRGSDILETEATALFVSIPAILDKEIKNENPVPLMPSIQSTKPPLAPSLSSHPNNPTGTQKDTTSTKQSQVVEESTTASSSKQPTKRLARGNARSMRGFTGKLGTEAGIIATFWSISENKSFQVIVRAPSSGNAAGFLLVLRPSKELLKARRNMRSGVTLADLATKPDDLVEVIRISPKKFDDVRIGEVNIQGKAKKIGGGFFASGPKTERCLACDSNGDTLLYLEFEDTDIAEEIRTIISYLVGE